MKLLIIFLACLLGPAAATLKLLHHLKLHKLGLIHGHGGLVGYYPPIIHVRGVGLDHGHDYAGGYGYSGYNGNINPGFGGNYASASASAGAFNGVSPGYDNNVAFANSGSGGYAGGSSAVAVAQAGSGYSGGYPLVNQYVPRNSYGTPLYR